MRRRTLIQLLVSGAGALAGRVSLRAQPAELSDADAGRLRAVADVVLPQEIGDEGRARVVASFLQWHRDYRAGAEMDHGYGVTRLRRTPPSPAANYPAQLAALDDEARRRGRSFAETPPEARRAIVETAIATAGVERLPSRPDGGHVATDLMGFFFDSIEANDLCYRARIGRDLCRDITSATDRPAPLTNGAR